jgi:hypothetical protein
LHANGASPFDLLRIGDQDLPPVRHQLIAHEPRPVHRLHHTSDRLVIDRHAAGHAVQAVTVRRRHEMINQLAPVADQADIDPLATEVQANTQHALSPPPRARRRQDHPTQPRTVTDGRFSVSMAGRAGTAARA